ncbi:MAG TPA: hypothetical protein VK175_10265 [Leadbetterella sp.]|nr:hypothetical protein [Leadbetterella sp.]
MKKTFISVSILFFASFMAFGQSITLTPTNPNQISVRGYGSQRPTLSGYTSQGSFSTPGAAGTLRLLVGIYGYGYTGSSFTTEPNASIELRTNNSYTSSSTGSRITFQTTADGSTSLFERMMISDIGNVGIGTSLPNGNLSFSNSNNNRKIVLYEDANNEHQFLGFGVNSQIFRYQIPSTSNNHVFYAGTSTSTSTELMRITGTGNVGIGTSNPISKLQVIGTLSVDHFTRLGQQAPGIKQIMLTDVTPAIDGGFLSYNHGLAPSQIISVDIMAETVVPFTGRLSFIPPNYKSTAEREYDYYIDNSVISIGLSSGNCNDIKSKQIKMLITYLESSVPFVI